jgi:hypothetical protein
VSGQRLSIGLRQADGAAALALVGVAEREGVDGVWIGDLEAADGGRGDSYRTMLSAAAAARTISIRLGCVLTLSDPDSALRLAEDLAMIDEAAGGRLELRDRLPDHVDRRLQPAQLVAAVLAPLQVGLQRLGLLRFQRAEQVGGEVGAPAPVLVDGAHEIPSASWVRIFSIPSRIRPLTVPSGMLSISAISEWLKPPK